MEAADPQTIAVAAAVGGALMLAAVRLFSSFNASSPADSVDKKTESSKSKSKTKKKKSKNKKKAAAGKQKEAITKPKKPEETKKTEIVKKVSIEEPAKPDSKKKNKKKKKKAKKEPKPVVEDDSSDDSSDDEKELQKKKKVVEEKKVAKASDFYDESRASEEGWETVPVKATRTSKPQTTSDASKGTDAKTKAPQKKEIVRLGEFVSVVLGEKGKTISNIQNVSGARVNVNKDANLCTITGDEESVAVAKQLVVSLISNQDKHSIKITSRLDKAILSKQDTRQQIRDISGAKVDFSFAEDILTVTVSGEGDKVEHAKELIQSYLDGKTPEGADGVKRIKVTGFQGRILIGQKGAQINQLQQESGASINVEFIDDNALAVVSVIGDEEQIAAGLSLIQKFLVQHNVKARVDLDQDARGGVMTKLNELRKEIPNLEVDVSEDRSEILLCGSAQGIRKGNEMLQNWIAKELGPPEIRSGEVLESIELGSAVGKVIGKNRSVLNSILANSIGAKIDIKKGSLCYVYGKPQPVAKALKAVKDIVAKHNDTVAKSQLEQEELQAANWVVVSENGMGASAGKDQVAPEGDWGGFKLAQSQHW